jgi:hypothetical protein
MDEERQQRRINTALVVMFCVGMLLPDGLLYYLKEES